MINNIRYFIIKKLGGLTQEQYKVSIANLMNSYVSKEKYNEVLQKITQIKTGGVNEKQFFVPYGVGDPAPSDPEKRRSYMAGVAGFHKEYVSDKIKHLVSDVQNQLGSLGGETFGYSNAEYDLLLKGTLNGLWLIHEWGEQAVNETLSHQRGVDDAEESVEERLEKVIN